MATTTNFAIVDDQNLSVLYSGSWGRAGASLEFNSTTSTPQEEGASVVFPFIGTSVQAYATFIGNPTVSLSIDNGAFTSTFQRPQADISANPFDAIHHQALWINSPLPLLSGNGSHTLSITSTSDLSVGSIFIDYFVYSVSASTPLEDAILFVDDHDTRIQYSEGWEPVNGSDAEFMHTTTSSTVAGNTVSFEFEGIGISLYGDIDGNTTAQMAEASIIIDNGSPITFAPSPQSQSSNVTNNNEYFTINNLEQGNHTITITALNNNPVFVDYFLVVPGNLTLAFPDTLPTSSTGLPVSSTQTTVPKVSGVKRKNDLKSIVGGTIAGIAVLAIILFLLFWARRRKKQSRLQNHVSLLTPSGSFSQESAVSEAVYQPWVSSTVASEYPTSSQNLIILSASSGLTFTPSPSTGSTTEILVPPAQIQGDSKGRSGRAQSYYVDNRLHIANVSEKSPPGYTVDDPGST